MRTAARSERGNRKLIETNENSGGEKNEAVPESLAGRSLTLLCAALLEFNVPL